MPAVSRRLTTVTVNKVLRSGCAGPVRERCDLRVRGRQRESGRRQLRVRRIRQLHLHGSGGQLRRQRSRHVLFRTVRGHHGHGVQRFGFDQERGRYAAAPFRPGPGKRSNIQQCVRVCVWGGGENCTTVTGDRDLRKRRKKPQVRSKRSDPTVGVGKTAGCL